MLLMIANQLCRIKIVIIIITTALKNQRIIMKTIIPIIHNQYYMEISSTVTQAIAQISTRIHLVFITVTLNGKWNPTARRLSWLSFSKISKEHIEAKWKHYVCLMNILQVIHLGIVFVEWVVAHSKRSTECAEDGAWQLVTHATTVAPSACRFWVTTTADKLKDMPRCINCSLAQILWHEAFVDMISFPPKLYWIHWWRFSTKYGTPDCYLLVCPQYIIVGDCTILVQKKTCQSSEPTLAVYTASWTGILWNHNMLTWTQLLALLPVSV